MSREKIASAIPARLKALREGKGLIQRDLATAAGMKQASVSEYESGKKVPGAEAAVALARALGVSTDFLLTGHDPPARLAPDELPQPVVRFASSLDAAAAASAEAGERAEDFRAIPLVEDAVAAGAARVMSDQVAGWCWVYGPLVGRRTNLVAVRVAGDSMAPVLPPGSVVVVDRGDRRISPRGVYLVKMDGGATVKRLELDGKELVLIPENREHRETRVQISEGQETPVVGRVVWSWTSWAPPDPEDDGAVVAEKRRKYKPGR